MTELTMYLSGTPCKKYFALCKPKVVLLIVFTAMVGMLLSTPGALPLELFFFATTGIALASASGAAMNHWVDQRIDCIMERTQNRPLPQGEMSGISALVFAITLGVISMVILITQVNMLTALLTLYYSGNDVTALFKAKSFSRYSRSFLPATEGKSLDARDSGAGECESSS